MKKSGLLFICLLWLHASFAATFTWTGKANTNNWNDVGNWSSTPAPSQAPGLQASSPTTDIVIIPAGTGTINLGSPVNVYEFTNSGHTINIGAYQLNITYSASFTNGLIKGSGGAVNVGTSASASANAVSFLGAPSWSKFSAA